MKIPAKTRYACLAVLELARFYGNDEPLSVSDICRNLDLSERFLTRILISLKKKGIVRSSRGALGGYTLAVKPEFITVGYIMTLFEEGVDLDDKIDITDKITPKEKINSSGESDEKLPPSFATPEMDLLGDVWSQAEARRQEYLNSTTFADLLRGLSEKESIMYEI